MSAALARGRGDPSTARDIETMIRRRLRRRNLRHGAAGLGVFVVGLAVPMLLDSHFYLNMLVQAVFLAIFAVSIGFLFRQLGRVSFGHAAFYGLSGYTTALSMSRWELNPALTLLLAIAAPTLFAFFVALLILRVSGVPFAMLTLAFGQSLYILSTRLRDLTGGFDGVSVRYPPSFLGLSRAQIANPSTFWYVAWGVLALVLLGVWLLSISRFGRLLIAIRENEERVRFVGYRTYMPRVIGFTVSGTVAGVAGALFALKQGFVSPEMLFWTTSGEGLIVAILGGTASMAGPVAGALVIQMGETLLLARFEYWRSILGVLVILVIFFAQGGLVGIVQRVTGRRGSSGLGAQTDTSSGRPRSRRHVRDCGPARL